MLRERCFLVDDLLTVIFKRLAERCFSSVFNGYIDKVTGTLFCVDVLTVILKTIPERCFLVQFQWLD